MTKICEDEQGIYLITNGAKHRPGTILGFSHAYDMSDAGLKNGDDVKAKHMSGTTMCKITLNTNQEIYWGNEYEHNKHRQIMRMIR